MFKITFVAPDGCAQSLEVSPGTNVMRAAVDLGVPGIEGECGGQLVCATCHVYLDPEWTEHFSSAGKLEQDLLDFVAAERRCSSRLACQLIVTETTDGCVVHLPTKQ